MFHWAKATVLASTWSEFCAQRSKFWSPHIKNFDTLTIWWIFWSMIYVKVSGWFSFKLLSSWCRVIQRQTVKNLWQWKELGNAWLFISSALVAKAISFFSMEEIVTTNSCRLWHLTAPKSWYQLLIYFFISRLVFHSFGYPYLFLCSQDFLSCNAAFYVTSFFSWLTFIDELLFIWFDRELWED